MISKKLENYVLTAHARFEIQRRGIKESDIRNVLNNPEQTEEIRIGRHVYQSKINLNNPLKEYLLRVFIDIDRDPPEVVTVYRTSKIQKHWR